MTPTGINKARLEYDFGLVDAAQYEAFWKARNTTFISREHFRPERRTFLEIGAGTGWFFIEMARQNPDTFFIAVERDRMRGNRLVHRATREKLANVAAYRGNAIPALMHGIPEVSVDRIYILYPCPWPKNSQRKHRWYLHPIMPHLLRVLRPGGLVVWASDQKFYIDEARFISETHYAVDVLVHGALAPNALNSLEQFPRGRTKFEAHFLATGQPCFELIVQKRLS